MNNAKQENTIAGDGLSTTIPVTELTMKRRINKKQTIKQNADIIGFIL